MKTSRLAKTGGIALASSMLLMGALPVASAMAASKPAVMLTGPSDVNQTAGSNVTYTASSSNVSNPNYQFWVEEPNGQWMMAQNWSSSNTFTLKNVQDGDYLVTAYVAPKGDWKAATNEQANGQQAVDGVFVDTSITVSAPSTLTAGQPVTVTASSSNIYDAQYQFWYKTPSGQWMQSGNYGSSSYTFTPSETGAYEFVAYAKSPLALNDPEGAAMSMNTATTTVGVAVPTLTNISVTNATSGTGTSASPATSLNGSSMTLSTTLMDSSGNPAPDVGITYAVSQSNGVPTAEPTATSNGVDVSYTNSSTASDFVVYTNSSGQASLTLTGPGTTQPYTVTAQAPYQVNGATLSSNTVYLEFVANGSAGISPYGSSDTSTYAAAVNTPVPVTVTLPPYNGAAQTNAEVEFSLNSNNSSDAYFASSSGGSLGTTPQYVYTNASGQATVYVESSNPNSSDYVEVTATPQNSPTSTSAVSTYLSFSEPGIATQVGNLTPATGYKPGVGSDVTISGTVEDSAGNPVADAQVFLAAQNNGGVGSDNGDDSYIANGTTTAFPEVDASTLDGSEANSNYGELLTTNSAGQFSATVTNSDATNDNYYVYSVTNGFVGTAYLTDGTTEIEWQPAASTLSSLTSAATPSGLLSTSTTKGLEATDSPSSVVTSPSTATGTELATAYFQPENANGDPYYGDNTYQLSASNGAKIASINGMALSTAVSSITVTVDTTSTGTETVTVPGNSSITANGMTDAEFSVGVIDTGVGASTLTASTSGQTATAGINFVAGAPSYVTNFPSDVVLNPGGYQNVTFQVLDADGNPVSDSAATIDVGNLDTATGLWITAVNNVSLQSGVGSSGATEPTPIPLAQTAPSGVTYDVSVPSVAAWSYDSSPNLVTAYTNSDGDVTLTIQAGDVSYYNGTSVVSSGSAGTSPVYVWTGDGASSTDGQVYLSGGTSASVYGPSASGYSNIGQINW